VWKSDKVLIATVAVIMVACLSAQGPPPVRLYPATDHPLRAEEVSKLSGYVAFVDGEDASKLGKSFELLPGCHAVVTPTRWGAHSPGGEMDITATTGRWAFVLPMRAGHRYEIRVIVGQASGPLLPLTIKAIETDLAGKQTREFERIKDMKGVDACEKDVRAR
jgi:hypothetical protein